MLTLINDILDFSKIEAGKIELESIDFDLQLTVEDALELLAPKAHDKGLELILQFAPGVPPHVAGDPGRVRQILLNLVGNAIKFTSEGEILIKVELEPGASSSSSPLVRFGIRDTGIGVPEEAAKKIFGAFTQAEASTSRNHGGTGLGLAISRQLAHLMGGQMGLLNNDGPGSEFWFNVHFAPTKAEPQKLALPAGLKDFRVLLVDDNATNRLTLSAQLRVLGCHVEEATGGQAAIDLLRAVPRDGDQFDLVLMDYQMPGMDGEATGRTILTDPQLQSIPLVLLTSSAQRGDGPKFRDLGFAGYLVKPVKGLNLRDCLRMILSARENGEKPDDAQFVTRHSIGEQRRRQGAKILVAEDNAVNQLIIRKMIEKIGHHPHVVGEGGAAVQALIDEPFDLILMDCQMPEMDGFEATAKIRQLKGGRERTPIIALTANAMEGDRQRCLDANMDDYLAKPLRLEDLRGKLTEWLEAA